MFFNLFYITFVVLNFIVMTKIEEFKKLLPNYIGDIDFEILTSCGEVNEVLTYISVPENIIKYDYYFLEECGCCFGKDSDTEDLYWYLEEMDEKDFNSLIEYINKINLVK